MHFLEKNLSFCLRADVDSSGFDLRLLVHDTLKLSVAMSLLAELCLVMNISEVVRRLFGR